MRLCRFDDNRLGVIKGDMVKDVTDALNILPPIQWPVPPGDHLISMLPQVVEAVERLLPGAETLRMDRVRLLSPVANPSKIIAAPLNYSAHVAEVGQSEVIHANTHSFDHKGFPTPVDKLGLFIKATTSLIGAGQAIEIVYPERRTDHEVELVAVIGRGGRNISETSALEHVCGYCIGLDMTVRGAEDRSFRKSPDTYTVIGPALVTADEVHDPDDLALSLYVNGRARQQARTRDLTVGVARLIAIASSCFTLYPGDLVMTGTPDGVGDVVGGDTIEARIESLGEMRVAVRGGGPAAIHGPGTQQQG